LNYYQFSFFFYLRKHLNLVISDKIKQQQKKS
jgi:hypothetical protein